MKRLLCVGLALLVAASACGSGGGRLSKSQYQAKLQSAFSAANAELGTTPRTPGSIDALTRVGRAYDDVAAALKGLQVPPAVQALNDRLAAAAAHRAAAVRSLVDRLKEAPPTDRKRLLAEYDTSAAACDDFDANVQALAAKGYRFRPSGGT